MSLVSVIVATYRRKDDLKNALVSLANQSYNDIEIVLVDDNGDPEWNTTVSDVVKSFRNEFPKIELEYIVNNPNQGSAKTRNIGIDAAKGKIKVMVSMFGRETPVELDALQVKQLN